MPYYCVKTLIIVLRKQCTFFYIHIANYKLTKRVNFGCICLNKRQNLAVIVLDCQFFRDSHFFIRRLSIVNL